MSYLIMHEQFREDWIAARPLESCRDNSDEFDDRVAEQV